MMKLERLESFQSYQEALLRLSEKNVLFSDKYDFLQETTFEDDICFWIDPLDGTGGFVNGHTEHVTCNIGITVKGKPLFGVIGKPFPNADQKPQLSSTYVGGL